MKRPGLAAARKLGTLSPVGRRALGVCAVTLVTSLFPACRGVLELDEYSVVDCWVPGGFRSGKPCYRCVPKTTHEVLNACTQSECVPFDNAARIDGLTDPLPPSPTAPRGDFGEYGSPRPPDPATGKCSSFTDAVFISGSTALEHIFKPLTADILKDVTIVFRALPSCDGVQSMSATWPADGMTTAKAFKQGVESICSVDVPHTSDIVLSDVPAGDGGCGRAKGAEFIERKGPVQLFMFAVPVSGGQDAISREAAFLTFGFPDKKHVGPWLDPKLVFRRSETSGTQRVIANVIGLEPNGLTGVLVKSSGAMIDALRDATPAAPAIGITSPDQLAREPEKVRALAYQHTGQGCAFHPDVVAGGRDKRNVRDGHYALWAPISIYQRAAAATGHTERVALMLAGTHPDATGLEYFKILKDGNVVPQCAMRVDRDGPSEPIKPFRPSLSCACAFERSGVAAPDVQCEECTTNAKCGAGRNCEHGHCEPR